VFDILSFLVGLFAGISLSFISALMVAVKMKSKIQ
jgi:hypothetical protein